MDHACYNTIKTLDPDSTVSLAKLRTVAVPQNGLVCEASWASMVDGGPILARDGPMFEVAKTPIFRRSQGDFGLHGVPMHTLVFTH